MKFARSRLDWGVIAFAVVTAYLVFLGAMFVGGLWLRDSTGAIIANDFIDVYAAGSLANEGHAASAYDWHAHHVEELAIAGHTFAGYYGWHYPPQFLFIASLLARFPYFIAFGLWALATLPLYMSVLSRITRNSKAWLFAFAFPAVLLDAYVGQNGFVSAALIGAVLMSLEEDPLVSGVFLGLLAYKPQFGILFPFVLIAAGQWRAVASAALTVALLAGVSTLAFGAQIWIAFLHSIPVTTQMVLEHGHAGWNKLQSIYGFVRWLGGSDRAAWVAQIAMVLSSVVALIELWRSRAPFAVKAAALATATLLATPYCYIYDFPVLAIALAYLWRARPFDLFEQRAVGFVCFCIAGFVVFGTPIALAGTLVTAALVARRVAESLAELMDVALQRT
jgi:hypothetical protein